MATTNTATEYFEKIERLHTEQLKVLGAINASFYENKNKIELNIGDTNFYIPSFVFLESRLTELENNLTKITKLPESGVAGIVYPKDGAMQKIYSFGYDNTPNQLKGLKTPTTFDYKRTDNYFKDIVRPNYFVSYDISEVPDNCKTVLVKKYTFTDNAIWEALKASFADGEATYGDIQAKIYLLREFVDYSSYITEYKLPTKNKDNFGDFKILKNEYISSDDTYSVTIDTDIYWSEFGAISHVLKENHLLITSDHRSVYKILSTIKDSVSGLTTIILKREEGYSTIVNTSDYPNFYFKFYERIDWSKSLKVLLEEDNNVMLFLAPMNSELNLQAPWSNAQFIDVNKLKAGFDDTQYYKDFYANHAHNMGDILNGLVLSANEQVYQYTKTQMDKMKSIKIPIKETDLEVVMINVHLNDTPTIKDIIRLHTQKNQIKNEITVLEDEIFNIQTILSTTSFKDTTEFNRQSYENQLKTLTSQRNIKTQGLIKIVNEITVKSDETTVPLDSAKYRIRGFISSIGVDDNVLKQPGETYDTSTIIGQLQTIDKDITVVKLDVEYRYKNRIKDTSEATKFKSGTFSVWNKMQSYERKKISVWDDINMLYKYIYEPINVDEDSYTLSQIDIPIQQGESVEIRVRAILNVGYPVIITETLFNDPFNIEFPDDIVKNVDILSIINDNNIDVEKAKFMDTLINDGYTDHVNNKVMDQDKTFFHLPENIPSGFYTQERRIVPLSDKLQELSNSLLSLEGIVTGNVSSALEVTIDDGTVMSIVHPFSPVKFSAGSYTKQASDYPDIIDPVVTRKLNLVIKNKSDKPISIYSILPGNSNTDLSETGYLGSNMYLQSYYDFPIVFNNQFHRQKFGQFIYFRTVNLFSGKPYFTNLTSDGRMITNDLSYGRPNNGNVDGLFYKVSQHTGTETATDTYGVLQNGTDTNGKKLYEIVLCNEENDFYLLPNHPLVKVYLNKGTFNEDILNKYIIPKSSNSNNGLQFPLPQNFISPNSEGPISGDIFVGQLDPSLNYTSITNSILGATLFPSLPSSENISVESGLDNATRTINGGGTISIPIYFQHKLRGGDEILPGIEKTISFDIRTSLYKDPSTYTITVQSTLDTMLNEELTTGKQYITSIDTNNL